ncbi:MAG TPA: arsenate reductase ArsC [Methylophilaceae bacterium]|nr:arsenate reductase ArsC [Methylophilaceae bacterium]
MNILFLCTGNSCRSIIAEAVFNHLAPPGIRAMSAGSHPTGQVHPRSVALLKQKGISTEGYYSKSWDDLPALPDIVITVCSNAAAETCPAYLGDSLRAHWGVDDPAKIIGSEEEMDAAFEHAYAILRNRVESFLSIVTQDMPNAYLKKELDRIGGLSDDITTKT